MVRGCTDVLEILLFRSPLPPATACHCTDSCTHTLRWLQSWCFSSGVFSPTVEVLEAATQVACTHFQVVLCYLTGVITFIAALLSPQSQSMIIIFDSAWMSFLLLPWDSSYPMQTSNLKWLVVEQPTGPAHPWKTSVVSLHSVHTHPHTLVADLSTSNFFSHGQEVQKIDQEMLKCCASHLSCTGALRLFFLLFYLHMQIFHCWVASIRPLFLPSAPGIMNN